MNKNLQETHANKHKAKGDLKDKYIKYADIYIYIM